MEWVDLICYYLSRLLYVYSWVLIIYILMSWIPSLRYTTIGQFMGKICEPYLEPFRRVIPPLGMIDLSPYAAILVLWFAQSGLYALPSILRQFIG